VLAHDNPFNRWVVSDGAVYFSDVESAAEQMKKLFSDNEYMQVLKSRSRENFNKNFQWDNILLQYEQLLEKFLPCENDR